MKTLYKYLILIFITVFASVFIYKYVEASTSVDVEEDILNIQKNKENEILANTKYSIDNPNVITDPYNVSPLTAMVIFETKDLATATVTIKGKDGDEDIVNTFLPSKIHILPIYGLYPDYNNTVIISSSGEEKTLTIQTKKLPSDIKDMKKVHSSDDDEFYFTTSLNGKPIGYDKNGKVRWYLNTNYNNEFIRLSNGHILLGNNHLIDSSYSVGLVEMDMLGKIYYEYNLPGGYHHDVFELSNGNLLTLSNDPENNSKEDYIVEIDRNSGEIIKNIKLSKLIKHENNDWIKLNSLVYDTKTNSIIVAGSKQDMIINIDYASEEINWIIGKAPKGLENKVLKTTDDITLPKSPKGLILTNNGNIAYINSSDDNNQLVIYSIDTNNRTVSEIKNIDLGSKSDYVNLTNNNDFIINQGNKLKKVTDDEVTTLFTTDYDIYSTNYMKIYAGDVYITGVGTRLGNIGITKTADNKGFLLWKLDRSIYKKYDLSLYKDVNRLVINGTFNKDDNVYVILDNVLNKSTYKVNIDKKAKMKKIKTATYINEEGLNGKYYIYLRVNGTTYKLEKYAVFY